MASSGGGSGMALELSRALEEGPSVWGIIWLRV